MTKLTEIKIENLKAFENNPFIFREDTAFDLLVESISNLGVLTPIIVRSLDDGQYEIISGHRRAEACKRLGIETIPCIVKELTRDEATVILVDLNLQRDEVLPSEKAHAYKMKMDALKNQGARTDLTSTQSVSKFRTAEEVGKENNESRETVRRYIRLTYLIPEILKLVDEGRIAFTPAVELSYLNEVEQADLVEEIHVCDATPNLSQAQRLRAISREEGLTPEHIGEILSEEKANQREKIRIPAERIRKYFPKSYTTEQIEEAIIKICESRYRARQGRDAR